MFIEYNLDSILNSDDNEKLKVVKLILDNLDLWGSESNKYDFHNKNYDKVKDIIDRVDELIKEGM